MISKESYDLNPRSFFPENSWSNFWPHNGADGVRVGDPLNRGSRACERSVLLGNHESRK